MEESTKKVLDLFFQISILIFTVVPVFVLYKTTPTKITAQALIIFGIIIGVFLVAIIFSFVYSKYKKMCKDIEGNKKDLQDIKKELNFKSMFNKMDKKVEVMERVMDKIVIGKISKIKSRKGMIDPRVMIWIILLILLYLFLKSMGVIN